jgi:hypothetical protein
MKTFSQFNNLIERKTPDPFDPKYDQSVSDTENRNIRKNKKEGRKVVNNINQRNPFKEPDASRVNPYRRFNPTEPFADDDLGQRTGKTGDKLKYERSSNTDAQKRARRFSQSYGSATGADPQTGRATYIPPKDSTQLPSNKGKTPTPDQYSRVDVGDIERKRIARLDSNTNKATDKGARNFAINQQTKGLSVKDGDKAMKNVDKIMKDTKSVDKIKDEINSEIGGRRARRSNSSTTPSTNTTSTKTPSTRTPSTPNLNPDQLSRMYQPDGGYGDSNTGYQGSGSTLDANKRDKKILNPTKKGTLGGFKTNRGGEVTVNTRIANSTPESSKVTFGDFKNKVTTSTKTNLLGKIKKARFYPYAKGASKITQRGLGLVGAGLQAKSNYDAAKGSKFRKIAKSAIQTASSVAGFTGGAAVGTGLGSITGPGAFVTGTVSGLAASDLAHKASGKIFNKIWKPPSEKNKNKDKKVLTPPGGNNSGGVNRKGGTHKGVSI